MKTFIYTLMIAPSLCLGFSAECKEVVIDAFVSREGLHPNEGIEACTKMIDNPKTEKRDLVHLYIARMRLYEEMRFFLAAANDKDHLKDLFARYPECIEEYLEFYDPNYLCLVNH